MSGLGTNVLTKGTVAQKASVLEQYSDLDTMLEEEKQRARTSRIWQPRDWQLDDLAAGGVAEPWAHRRKKTMDSLEEREN